MFLWRMKMRVKLLGLHSVRILMKSREWCKNNFRGTGNNVPIFDSLLPWRNCLPSIVDMNVFPFLSLFVETIWKNSVNFSSFRNVCMQKKKSTHNAHINNANDAENGHRSRRANIPTRHCWLTQFLDSLITHQSANRWLCHILSNEYR